MPSLRKGESIYKPGNALFCTSGFSGCLNFLPLFLFQWKKRWRRYKKQLGFREDKKALDTVTYCTDISISKPSTKQTVWGASKIKFNHVNKKRMATARRLIFFEFLKASIADLITLLFSSLQNSESDGNSGDSCADPCQFLPFLKTKIQLSTSPSLLRSLAKNLQKQKSLLGSMWRKSKQKIRKKAF